MDPQAYLALSPEQQNAYLKSLTAEQRLAFIQSVDDHEQAQITAEEGAPTAKPPVRNTPAVLAPLPTLPPRPLSSIKSEDPAIAAEIANIKAKDPNQRTVDEKDDMLRSSVSKLKDRMTSLASVTSAFTDMANLSDPASTEVAPGAIAGGLSGLASGGPLGALIGTVTGALKAGNQREGYEQQEAERKRKMFTGLRVAPTKYAETGGIAEVDTEIEIPVQEEEGEVMLFPDGRLVDTMATKRHKDMKGDEKNRPSDIIPSGTMIFSDSKKRLIDLAKIKDDVFTITRGNYSEEGNVPGETITMGDVFGKKGKVTPAFLAKKIRKQFPVKENPVEQYEIETNKENMRRRAELLRPVMEMQEKVYRKFTFEKPEKFEKGGMAKAKSKKRTIPVYEGGTDGCGVGFKKDPDGNCIPDIIALAGMGDEGLKLIAGYGDDYDRELTTNAIKDYQIMTMGDNPEEATDGLATDNTKQVADPEVSLAPGKSVGFKRKPPTITMGPDGKAIISGYPEGETEETTGPFTTPEKKEPIVVNPNITNPKLSDEILGGADKIFADQRAQTEEGYSKFLTENDNLYRSQRFRNIAILGSRLAGVAMQNPNETPEVKGTEHIGGMFPEISESQIQGQINPIRRGQNRVLSAINDSGLSGSRVSSAIAPVQARMLETESDIREKALGVNQAQRAKRHERLQQIVDFNKNSEIKAENATRGNRNHLVSQVGEIAADSVKAGGELKNAWSQRKQELEKWRQENRNTITQSEYNNLLKKEELKMKREWDDKVRTGIEELLKNLFK